MIALGTQPTIEDEAIEPQQGPQWAFAEATADVVIYGGSAGCGKTRALLMEPLRNIENGEFGAVIFRRTFPQITAEGALWDEACKIYPLAGAEMIFGSLEARFPSGAKVTFRHMQYEQNRMDWQGSQICLVIFDELTHFTAAQFWYLFSRNRSTCGVKPYIRASTNPEAGSWVHILISWWIDPSTGYPIPERAGVVRWFARINDELIWGDSSAELRARYPQSRPKSLTFIPGTLDDNPALTEADPGYRANLMALPRVERERLLGGNWLARETSIIDPTWLRRYALTNGGAILQIIVADEVKDIKVSDCQRFATVDTAGTSKEKAREAKGSRASNSACGIWDYSRKHDALMLRHMWCEGVAWSGLKTGVRDVLKRWGVKVVHIENAHFGPALLDELPGVQTHLIGPKIPKMRESGTGLNSAKLERATASGLLSRLEFGGFFVPEDGPSCPEWVSPYRAEMVAWSGHPDEMFDRGDVSSYGAYVAKQKTHSWGGVVKV